MILDHVAGQNKNSLQNTERKNVGQFQSYAPLIFGHHLGHRNLECDQKLFFYEIFPITSPKQKTES
jgi:hypothetical protein